MTDVCVLSRLTIPCESALNERLRTSYDWHRWIWRAFPSEPDKRRDFLFRVDVMGSMIRVLLLSHEKPAAVGEWKWESKPVSGQFLSCPDFRFQVRVNPTFRRSSDHRRIALFSERDLREWLTRKLAAIGAQLISVDVGSPVVESFTKDGKHGKHVAVDFRGVMSVTDKALFEAGFLQGIGSAKGFGYGLLMLQPIQL